MTAPADRPWGDAVSANMGWWTMFTIYPKVGGGMWHWRQSILSDRDSRRSANDLLAG
ncbi:UNVERIFIED_ORG: hypothetical protein J2Y81_004084 [Paraburkholderia sediminicola]|nr:hypothetical protein [Paraburkholderia sediminicola]